MNPYQPGEDNQDPYEVGYKAGAASRDAEVVSLTNQRDYEYVRAENAEQERDQFEQERDQFREQVALLRDALKEAVEDYSDRFDMSSPSTNPGIKTVVKQGKEALAATEPE